MSSAVRVRTAFGAARSLFSQVLPWLGALRWLVSLVVHGSVRSAQEWPQRCALSLALCVGGSRCRSTRRRLVAVCVASCASSINHSTQTPTFILTLLLKHARAQQGRRVTFASVCQVALSSFVSSAAAFAETLRDLIGDGLCSRRTMSRIRDAFAGVVVEMSNVRLAQAVVAATSAGVAELAAEPCVGTAQCAGGPLFVAAVLHIHDEASLRLRSRVATDATGVPERSRGYTCQWSCTPWRVRPLLCWRHRCTR